MPVTIDATLSGLADKRQPYRAGSGYGDAPQRILVLQNPGRVSRHYLEGIIQACRREGIEHHVCELGPIWQRKGTDTAGVTRETAELVRSERIGAVLGYVFNGLTDMQAVREADGRVRSFFETLGVPHLMLWTDHPQWALEKAALSPALQPLLRSSNCCHFLKSEAAAREVQHVLGWMNCYGLPVAEDPDLVRPATGVSTEYDVAALVGSPPQMDDKLVGFLEQDEPDVAAINAIVADTVRRKLDELWCRDVPPSLRPAMEALGEHWLDLRRMDVRTAAVRHLPVLAGDHPEALGWLIGHPGTYFDTIERLWLFGGWQRTFILAYLAKYFRVAVFGADWTALGLGGGEWVDYRDQAAAYARGRIAINISQGSEEEGLSHKPFQIAASGVPMMHIDRVGLSDCFEIGREVETFETPQEAREIVATLLADPPRRAAMADAARRRFIRDHTWARRLEQMFARAGLSLTQFKDGVHVPVPQS